MWVVATRAWKYGKWVLGKIHYNDVKALAHHYFSGSLWWLPRTFFSNSCFQTQKFSQKKIPVIRKKIFKHSRSCNKKICQGRVLPLNLHWPWNHFLLPSLLIFLGFIFLLVCLVSCVRDLNTFSSYHHIFQARMENKLLMFSFVVKYVFVFIFHFSPLLIKTQESPSSTSVSSISELSPSSEVASPASSSQSTELNETILTGWWSSNKLRKKLNIFEMFELKIEINFSN